MRVVKRGECVGQSFFLKRGVGLCLFSFPGGSGFQDVFPAAAAPASSRCSSSYPGRLRLGKQHRMTFAVLARKRARPIHQAGRGQPQGRTGARRFKSSGGLQGVLVVRRGDSLGPDHHPAQGGRLGALGFPPPQVHGPLPRKGHDGFPARALAGLGLAQHRRPLLHPFAFRLPDHQPPGQCDQGRAQARVAGFGDRQPVTGSAAGADAPAPAGVTAHLAAILEAIPVAHFALDQRVGQVRPAPWVAPRARRLPDSPGRWPASGSRSGARGGRVPVVPPASREV